jgi:hypothetical protein
MEEKSLSIGTVLELLAWTDRTVLLNNQHKEEFCMLCREWLIGHGHKFAKVSKPVVVPVGANPADTKTAEAPLSPENDPYFRSIDRQIEEINDIRRQREAEKSLAKYNKKSRNPRATSPKKTAKTKVKRKKG